MSVCQRRFALWLECDASPVEAQPVPWRLVSGEMSGENIGPRNRSSLYRRSHLFVKSLQIYGFAALPTRIGWQIRARDG